MAVSPFLLQFIPVARASIMTNRTRGTVLCVAPNIIVLTILMDCLSVYCALTLSLGVLMDVPVQAVFHQ